MTVGILLIVGIAIGIALGGLAVEFAPRKTANTIHRVPMLRSLLLATCARCGEPAIRAGAEEMPLVFMPNSGSDVTTLRFCRTCSHCMTAMERIDILNEYAPDDIRAQVRMKPTEAESGGVEDDV